MPVEDTVHLRARSATGVLASIDLSWSLTKSLEDYVLLHGTNGTLRVGWRESKYRTASSTDWVVFGNGYDKLDALRSEVENFCRALRGLEPLRITAEEALASARVIDAAYASLHGGSGAWVEVEA
jgi:predicted dehydrogenase